MEIDVSTLMRPRRLVPPLSWVGHIPFAFWLMHQTKPKVFVELGTHSGNSYFAFCQAAEAYHLPTKLFSVDTWQGDEHAGFYGDEIWEDVSAYNAEHHDDRSTLMRMTFDQAVDHFEDGTIDLLHIDGLHTYEAVKHDFETWLPKMSCRGIVLFHDTEVHDEGFGVYRLWEELLEAYPGFSFSHSHGLGVLLVGRAANKELVAAAMGRKVRLSLPSFFSFLGEGMGDVLEMRDQLSNARAMVSERDTRLSERGIQLSELRQQLESLGIAHSHALAVVSERDTQLSELRQQLESLGIAYSHAQAVVSERDAQLSALANRLDDMISEFNMELSMLRSELAQRNEELDNIRSTLGESWVGRWCLGRISKDEN